LLDLVAPREVGTLLVMLRFGSMLNTAVEEASEDGTGDTCKFQEIVLSFIPTAMHDTKIHARYVINTCILHMQ
jgi:hypothetical protein